MSTLRKRYLYVSLTVLLAILLTALVWQVSFSFGEYGPANPAQTFVFWAVSTLIFLLTATLSFMLFRTGVKLYIDRQSNREGSRIQTKLVLGGLGLSLLPVVFLFAFGYVILNRTIGKWFMAPAEGVRVNLVETAVALDGEVKIARRRWRIGWRRTRKFARTRRISRRFARRIEFPSCGSAPRIYVLRAMLISQSLWKRSHRWAMDGCW